ncbi:MAG: hypothetical protein PHP32_06770 [Candidatus Izemoplasmatales bacterium]|nr:hypothetical protein [Candidatus Izemoplasmatales bacterium]
MNRTITKRLLITCFVVAGFLMGIAYVGSNHEVLGYEAVADIEGWPLYDLGLDACPTAIEGLPRDRDGDSGYLTCIISESYRLKKGFVVLTLDEAIEQGHVTLAELDPYIPQLVIFSHDDFPY